MIVGPVSGKHHHEFRAVSGGNGARQTGMPGDAERQFIHAFILVERCVGHDSSPCGHMLSIPYIAAVASVFPRLERVNARKGDRLPILMAGGGAPGGHG